MWKWKRLVFWWRNVSRSLLACQLIEQIKKIFDSGRDKHYTAKLQKTTQIVENYRNDPERYLQIIDPYSMEFLVRSQTNPKSWYAFNLNSECCECNDRVYICKHVLAVWILLNWELEHLKILLLSNEEVFLHTIYENFKVKTSIQAGRLTKNDTLFDNEENNPISMLKTRSIYKFINI